VSYKPKVDTSRGRTPGPGLGYASCESCDFRMQCTRERARIHVAQNGHVVHFVIRNVTTYFPKARPS